MPLFLADIFARKRGAGDAALIVNMIDQRVWRLTPRYITYTLSKSALWTATQTLAQALAPGIRVNALGPGPTLAHTSISEAQFAELGDKLPLRQMPAVGEFGRAIRFLWDTPSVTGQMLALDGGQHLAWETPDQAGFDV